MKHLPSILVALSIFLFTGCAKPPTPQQIATANYGSFPSSYQEIIKTFMHDGLFDPYSAMYEKWSGPSKGYFYSVGGQWFGYRVCVNINAKNKFGAYVGASRHYFLLNNGKVTVYRDGSGSSSYLVNKLCNF